MPFQNPWPELVPRAQILFSAAGQKFHGGLLQKMTSWHETGILLKFSGSIGKTLRKIVLKYFLIPISDKIVTDCQKLGKLRKKAKNAKNRFLRAKLFISRFFSSPKQLKICHIVKLGRNAHKLWPFLHQRFETFFYDPFTRKKERLAKLPAYFPVLFKYLDCCSKLKKMSCH